MRSTLAPCAHVHTGRRHTVYANVQASQDTTRRAADLLQRVINLYAFEEALPAKLAEGRADSRFCFSLCVYARVHACVRLPACMPLCLCVSVPVSVCCLRAYVRACVRLYRLRGVRTPGVALCNSR